MNEEKKTYKNILIATSIFGSVQMVTLISSFIKHKLLSFLIGVGGYGIFGMLNSIIDLIKSISGFSIENSAVKTIASEKKDTDVNAKIVIKLSILTGFIGCFIVILFSSMISQYVFKSSGKWYLIVFLSFAVFFKQITGAFNAILQGKSKLKQLAKSNIVSNIVSLMITIPFFYFFKRDFIIPAIVITTIINALIYWFFVRKFVDLKNFLSFKDSIINGKEIIYFGGLLMIMSFLPLLVNYLIQILINDSEGINAVGIYNVSMIILNTYVGFIFSAMATEYYPRLVSLDQKNKELSLAVKRQAILSTLLIVPVIIVFIVFGEYIISILFSNEFMLAYILLKWAVVGLFFKAISFSIGYLFIAKADSKVFTKTSLGFNILYFFMLSFAFKFDSLKGIGIAIMIYFLLHFICVYSIARKRYNMSFFSKNDFLFFIILFCFILLSLYFVTLEGKLKIILICLLLIVNGFYTFYKINSLVSINKIFKRR
ncbi:oligosaccharide flippase family protein [Flavobacterium sp.]|uniref:oligosaccharide flippase family protein n=2 Tax=Flavobacterium sp. TaxID=239 RepID=UPI004048D96F